MTGGSETRTDGKTRWGLMGAVAAAVGASVCCLGPLLLLALPYAIPYVYDIP